MNKEIQIFKNQEFGEIRTIKKDGEPWFVANDVARILGYKKPENAISSHCKSVSTCPLESGGQVRHMIIIPERDVYRLVMRSKLPAAEEFEDWVVGEVLPTIRKTGGYVDNAAGFVNSYFSDMADDAKIIMIQILDSRKRLLLEKDKLLSVQEKLLPKAEFYDDVAGSKSAIEMSKVAKVLDIKGMGRTNLFQFLRDQKVLRKDNEPYQDMIDRGYFRTIEQKWQKPNGDIYINIKTLVYQKGLDYIRKLIKKNRGE